MNNENRSIKRMALCGLLAVVMLLTGFLIVGGNASINKANAVDIDVQVTAKNNNVKAEIFKPEVNKIYRVSTSIPLIFIDCMYFFDNLLGSGYSFNQPVPLGYNLVSVEKLSSAPDDLAIISPSSPGGYWGVIGLATKTYEINTLVVVVLVQDESYEGLPLPEPPIKEGYTFTQWYMDEACTTPYDGREITADLTLYAGWQINTYTVRFNSDGGSAVDNKTVDWNTAVALSPITRVGYNFLGWFLADGTQYTNQSIKENTILIAHWEVILFTVTFKVGNEVYKTMQVPYGTSFGVVMSTAEMSEYTLRSFALDNGAQLGADIGELSITDNV